MAIASTISLALAGGVAAPTGAAATTHAWPIVARTAQMIPMALSCASKTFCLAIGRTSSQSVLTQYFSIWNGIAATRRAAIPGAKFEPLDDEGGLQSVSCPTRTFCMAVGLGTESTRTYAWGSGGWRALPIERPLPLKPAPPPRESEPGPSGWTTVSCTSDRYCLAAGVIEDLVFKGSTERLDAATTFDRWNGRAWTRIQTIQGLDIESMSCAGATRCVGVGSSSAVWNGTRWRVVHIPGQTTNSATSAAYRSISCTPDFTCIAIGTENPSGRSLMPASAKWHQGWQIFSTPDFHATGVYPVGISCISAASCLETGISETTADVSYVSRYNGIGWSNTRISGAADIGPDIVGTSATTSVIVDQPNLSAVSTDWLAER